MWVLVWCVTMLSVLQSNVHSAPIIVDFNTCQAAQYPLTPDPAGPTSSIQCCPLKPTKPIIDGAPGPSTGYTRVRLASQCTDANYASKLERAYALMRALPDDDPRSFTQQWYLHCSYCGGAFLTPVNGTSTGIDIHFSWLFFPWHRYFLYFHERILQNLLGDPTFSLNFWNWDSPYAVGPGGTVGPACLSAGQNFPTALYGNPSAATYDTNRSANAKGQGRLLFPDFTFSPALSAVQQPLYNASAEELVQSNMNVMYQALVSGGTTQATFLGRPYRAGDLQGTPTPNGGSGSLEATAHAGVHFWTGQDPPVTTNDMGALAYSARDPVFFAHHSNIDRLWEVWKSLGPLLGQTREDYSDPDFLNAEFLFYDEYKELRRVKVGDCLDTRKLGYVYQKANDAAWITANQTTCSSLTYDQLLAQAGSRPVPVRDSNGNYALQAGTQFMIVIDRPSTSNGAQEFLSVSGIKLNRLVNTGFDVFVNLIDPPQYGVASRCAEYVGRFINMAQGRGSTNPNQQFIWEESITQTLGAIGAQPAPSKLVVTILPFSRFGMTESITFQSISVTTTSA